MLIFNTPKDKCAIKIQGGTRNYPKFHQCIVKRVHVIRVVANQK